MDPTSVIKQSWNEMLNEEKAMQEQEYKAMQEQKSTQELTHCYEIILTLKSGKQVKILSKKSYDEAKYDSLNDEIVLDGFIKNPLLVEKTIKVVPEEIAAIEIIKDPCIAQVIPWPNLEKEINPGAGAKLTTPDAALGSGHHSKKNVACNKHDESCAIFKNPRSGVSLNESKCDCGYVVHRRG